MSCLIHSSFFDCLSTYLSAVFRILGDDSVLLKYLNPHAALVVTVSPPGAVAEPLFKAGSSPDAPYTPLCSDAGYNVNETSGVSAVSSCKLHISLVDTVSGKLLYRMTHEHSTGPVHATLFENMLAYTFWNAQLKRVELSTIGLFEGMIDKYGLTPFATHSSAAAAANYVGPEAGIHSAFSSSTPLGIPSYYQSSADFVYCYLYQIILNCSCSEDLRTSSCSDNFGLHRECSRYCK